jgi:hypothetical protein
MEFLLINHPLDCPLRLPDGQGLVVVDDNKIAPLPSMFPSRKADPIGMSTNDDRPSMRLTVGVRITLRVRRGYYEPRWSRLQHGQRT